MRRRRDRDPVFPFDRGVYPARRCGCVAQSFEKNAPRKRGRQTNHSDVMTTDVFKDQAPPRDASVVKDALPPAPPDTFVPRHIGPSDADVSEMLASLDLSSL